MRVQDRLLTKPLIPNCGANDTLWELNRRREADILLSWLTIQCLILNREWLVFCKAILHLSDRLDGHRMCSRRFACDVINDRFSRALCSVLTLRKYSAFKNWPPRKIYEKSQFLVRCMSLGCITMKENTFSWIQKRLIKKNYKLPPTHAICLDTAAKINCKKTSFK